MFFGWFGRARRVAQQELLLFQFLTNGRSSLSRGIQRQGRPAPLVPHTYIAGDDLRKRPRNGADRYWIVKGIPGRYFSGQDATCQRCG
jgi:hypothetical protein